MKKNTLKACCTTIASVLLVSSVPFINSSDTKASAYRTEYTIYGDINGDKVIDSFDIIAIKKKIAAGKYDELYDLNCDKKLDIEDTKLLQNYVLGDKTVFDAYYSKDTDGDEISDFSEITDFGTDPDSADTDNDGLTDLEEIVYTKTSPLDKFSNGTTISDGEFDSDSDGLSNAEEVKLKTDPLNEDTDYDSLTDTVEINEYKTNPVNYDSDEDNISDGDEIALSLNPNNKTSDGINNDNEVTTVQSISSDSEKLNDVNEQSWNFNLNLQIESAGVAENNVNVVKSAYSDLLREDNIIMSDLLDISFNNSLTVKKVRIEFEKKFKNTPTSDFMIFRFSPEDCTFLPVETKYTDNTLYTETTEFGTYCVVHIAAFADRFKQSIINTEYNQLPFTVVYMIDESEKSKDTLEQRKKFIKSSINKIWKKFPNACALIIPYYRDTENMSIFNSTGKFYGYMAHANEYNTWANYGINDNIWVLEIGINHMIFHKNSSLYFYYPNTSNNQKSFDEILNGITSHGTDCEANTCLDALYTLAVNSVDCHQGGDIIPPWSQFNFLFAAHGRSQVFILSDETPDLNGTLTVNKIPVSDALKELKSKNVKIDFVSSIDNSSSEVFTTLRDIYDCRTHSLDDLEGICEDIGEDSLETKNNCRDIYDGSGRISSMPTSINQYDFIARTPASFDKTRMPEADINGNINFEDAYSKAVNNTNQQGKIYKNLEETCSDKNDTAKGYKQLISSIDENPAVDENTAQIIKSINVLQYIPFSNDSTDETSSTLQVAGKWNGKTYCFPPRYYSEIKPVNKYIREEGVNGETQNGEWVPWY